MIKGRRHPAIGGVTVIAAVVTGDVAGRLARGRGAVVTTEAGTNHRIVIHARKWFPELIRVTFFAQQIRPNMIRRQLVRGHLTGLIVTSLARYRRSLKQPAQVATGTCCIFMRTIKREAC